MMQDETVLGHFVNLQIHQLQLTPFKDITRNGQLSLPKSQLAKNINQSIFVILHYLKHSFKEIIEPVWALLKLQKSRSLCLYIIIILI
jgi:hypothetical protein